MTFIVADRVQETTNSPGTGTATLLGAVSGYQSFSTGVGINNTTFYVIADQLGTNWEVGLGALNSTGTVLTRTTVYSSSNGGSTVNFATGTQYVWCDYPSSKAVIQGAAVNFSSIGATTAGTGAFTTLSASSTVSGAGFSNYFAAPPTIGNTTPNAGTFTNLAYTGTLTGGTGVVNLGSGQFYKDASGNVGIGTSSPSGILDARGAKFLFGSGTYPTAGTTSEFWNSASNASGSATIGCYTGTSNTITSMISFDGNSELFSSSYWQFAAGGTERMRLTSAGYLGINTTSPNQLLDVRGAVTLGSATTYVPTISRSTIPAGSQGIFITANYNQSETTGAFTWADTASYGAGIYLAGNAPDAYGGSVNIYAYSSGANGNFISFNRRSGSGTVAESARFTTTGNLQFSTSNAGIVFNNSSAVTNSTLNDYETGSFNPTILFGGNNVGQTFNNGPNGRYVKIGKFVYITIGWYFSNKGSSTGNMTIGNLPFTADNFGFYGTYSPINLSGLTSVPNNIVMVGTNGGTSYVTVYQGDCGTALTNSNVSNGTYGIIGFSYTANF